MIKTILAVLALLIVTGICIYIHWLDDRSEKIERMLDDAECKGIEPDFEKIWEEILKDGGRR